MEISSVGIIYNPISGAGRALRQATEFAALARRGGLTVAVKESQRSYRDDLKPFLAGLDALVVAGGDGTLSALLPHLLQTPVPVYMLPAGNQSLFAREFKMSSSTNEVLAAFKRPAVSQHYAASLNSSYFFNMMSVGFDSAVVEKVCSERHGTVGNIGYIVPIIRCIARHKAPKITLTVDGTQVLDSKEGLLIIGNTRQYALGIKLLPSISSSDPFLIANFFPYSRLRELLRLGMSAVLSLPVLQSLSLTFRGTDFLVETDPAHPVQADGEHIGNTPARVRLTSSSFRVLKKSITE